jgi:predicted ArsR family transcriptional regulator
MQKTTRKRILEYLENREPVTASELAQVFRMTAANARHHLSVLAEEGILVIVATAKDSLTRNRRGRPVQYYQLRSNARANNLVQLSSALLQIVHSNDEGTILRLATLLAGEAIQARTMTARLQQTIAKLNIMNYRARWEAHVDAPRIVFGHCPYSAILSDHPSLCQMDARILSIILNAKIEQLVKYEELTPGTYQCVFRLGANQ